MNIIKSKYGSRLTNEQFDDCFRAEISHSLNYEATKCNGMSKIPLIDLFFLLRIFMLCRFSMYYLVIILYKNINKNFYMSNYIFEIECFFVHFVNSP